MHSTNSQTVTWQEHDQTYQANWLIDPFGQAPKRILPVNDEIKAEQAYRLMCEGSALLWRGDFHNARQLLQAIARRIDRPNKKKSNNQQAADIKQLFHQTRQQQAQRSVLLNNLLIELDHSWRCRLRRAPDVQAAVQAALGHPDTTSNQATLISLRNLQGIIGAYQWRLKGVAVEALSATLYPFYGVFAPIRSEYLKLVANADLSFNPQHALDIGTGTGVLAAILARRNIPKIIATDINPQAIACAQFNLEQLGVAQQVTIEAADLFPADTKNSLFDLIVCNPPWLPGKPSSALEYAVYDQNSSMLKTVLQQAPKYLAQEGQLWIVLSDLAEHLQLRSREELLRWIDQAGLAVSQRLDTKPVHKRSQEINDPLYAARHQEVTSLWCLVHQSAT